MLSNINHIKREASVDWRHQNSLFCTALSAPCIFVKYFLVTPAVTQVDLSGSWVPMPEIKTITLDTFHANSAGAQNITAVEA